MDCVVDIVGQWQGKCPVHEPLLETGTPTKLRLGIKDEVEVGRARALLRSGLSAGRTESHSR